MTAKEYRECANECLGWARSARSEKEREGFLLMADTWFRAALIAEQRDKPDRREQLDVIGVSLT